MPSEIIDCFDLPEGSIPMGAVAVCQYIDPNGIMRFVYNYDTSNMPLSTTLGLLDLAKYDIHAISQEE